MAQVLLELGPPQTKQPPDQQVMSSLQPVVSQRWIYEKPYLSLEFRLKDRMVTEAYGGFFDFMTANQMRGVNTPTTKSAAD